MKKKQPLKKPELLVPAGNMEKLRTAIHFGADAVYLGGEEFSLRARAENFSLKEMERAIREARSQNVKVYVTVNAFARNQDMDQLPSYLEDLGKLGPDAVIVSDPGVLSLVKDLLPHMSIHLSTQANTTNRASCRFWEGQGVERIGLARELSLPEIQEIRQHVSAELEVFIHGALCISYSGRCWMSKFMADRDANIGDCAQSCRWEYFLTESKREGEYFPVEGDEKGTYLFNSKDLCLLEALPDLLRAGVNAFKIEGRMKTLYYVGVVTNVYRAALDRCWEDPNTFAVLPEWREELASVSHRGYITGFLYGPPKDDRLLHTFSPYRPYDFIGIVQGSSLGRFPVEVKNRFQPGDSVEIVEKGKAAQCLEIQEIRDEMGNLLSSAKPNTHVFIGVNGLELKEFALMRKKRKE